MAPKTATVAEESIEDNVESTQPAKPSPAVANGQQRVRWNTQNLKSAYINFCHGTCTREEVVLNFGINHDWERARQNEMEIELLQRIIVSPFVAKRLTDFLNQLMKDYEQRYGELK